MPPGYEIASVGLRQRIARQPSNRLQGSEDLRRAASASAAALWSGRRIRPSACICGSLTLPSEATSVERSSLPLLGGETDQHIARGRSHFAELKVHRRRGPASERAHVEWRQLRVAHHHFDLARSAHEFFRNCLAQRCPYVLANLNFAGINRDLAVFSDVKPCIDFLRKGIAATPARSAGFLGCESASVPKQPPARRQGI